MLDHFRLEKSGSPFDAIRQLRADGEEFWSARELGPMLGYGTWDRFVGALDRARLACANTGQSVPDHFRGVAKLVGVGSGATREVADWHLSRFGAYLCALNGDPRKPEVAGAQAYFAVRTREAEIGREARRLSTLELLELGANAERRRLELEAKAVEAAPKAAAFDALMDSEGIFTMQQAAKMLGSGEIRLFKFLRNRNVLLSSSDCWNQPAQKFVQRKLFEIKVSRFTDSEGVQHARTKTFVTTRGLEYIRRLLEAA